MKKIKLTPMRVLLLANVLTLVFNAAVFGLHYTLIPIVGVLYSIVLVLAEKRVFDLADCIKVLKDHIHDLASEGDKLESLVKLHKKEKAEIYKNLQNHITEANILKADYEALHDNYEEKCKYYDSLLKTKRRVEKDLVLTNEEIDKKKAEILDLEEKNQTKDKMIAETLGMKESYRQKLEKAKEQIKDLQDKFNHVCEQRNKMEQKYKASQMEIDKMCKSAQRGKELLKNSGFQLIRE